MPLPSLVSLNLAFIDRVNSDILRGSLEQASKFSPNISELWIQVHRRDTSLSKFLSGCVCRWRNLQTLFCSGIALDKDALVNLSRISALTQLTFLLNDTSVGEITSSALPFVFSNLHYFTLYSEFLDLTSRCLSRLQLPAITDFAAIVSNCPSKLDVSSFLASLQTLGADHTIQRLELYHDITSYNPYIGIDSQHVLTLEDLQPCMAFTNLRSMYLDIGWDVGLTSSDLLTLALAWPSLEDLVINREWGWNTPSGISPHGLLQLLQTCRSLNRIALAIDTRGYTEFFPSSSSVELSLPTTFSINVVDSVILEEAVAAASFLASIAPCPDFSFSAWMCPLKSGSETGSLYWKRWDDVYEQARDAISKCLHTAFSSLMTPRITHAGRAGDKSSASIAGLGHGS